MTALLEAALTASQRRAIFAKIARGSGEIGTSFLHASAIQGRLAGVSLRLDRKRWAGRLQPSARRSRADAVRDSRKFLSTIAPSPMTRKMGRIAFSRAFSRAVDKPPKITKVTTSPSIRSIKVGEKDVSTKFQLKDQFGTPFAEVTLASQSFSKGDRGIPTVTPLLKTNKARMDVVSLGVDRSGRASRDAGAMGMAFRVPVGRLKSILRDLKARFPNLKSISGKRFSGAAVGRMANLQLAQFQDRVGILLQELVA